MAPFNLGGIFGGQPMVGSQRFNQNLLGQAGQAGFFDPMGSARLRALRRRQFLANAAAQRGASSRYGQLIGLDPMSQRQALIQGDISANAGLAGGLNEAEFQEQMGNRDFFRDLYRGELDFQRQQALQRQAEKAARSGGMGGALGGLFGTALSFIPGGSLFSGGARGTSGPRMGQSGYRYPYEG